MSAKRPSYEKFVDGPMRGGWVDHHGRKRTMPMELLVLGMPRTGTSSMMDALEILGYNNVYHMRSVILNVLDADLWVEAAEDTWGKMNAYGMGDGNGKKAWKTEDWDQILGGVSAVTDFPCAAFSIELMRAYPDAKIILTTRDASSWFRSMKTTILSALRSNFITIIGTIDPIFTGRFQHMVGILISNFYGENQVNIQDEKAFVQRFNEHYDRVRKEARAMGREIVDIGVKEPDDVKWDKMCKLLGKERPQCAWPRSNESEEFAKMRDTMFLNIVRGMVRRWFTSALPVALSLAVVGVAWKWGALDGIVEVARAKLGR